MPGLPVIGLRTKADQFRIGREQAGRFHIDHEGRVRVQFGKIARQHDADLVRENLVALVVDHTATIAVTVEAKANIRAVLLDRMGDGMEHFHVFRVRVVAREGVIQLDIKRNDLAAQRLENLRRERARRAIAAGRDDLQLALELGPGGEVLVIGLVEIADEGIAASAIQRKSAAEHDFLEAVHLVRPEGDRALGTHLHAGPAVVVVRGRHHRHRRHIERELREIRHWRQRESDINNLAA